MHILLYIIDIFVYILQNIDMVIKIQDKKINIDKKGQSCYTDFINMEVNDEKTGRADKYF